MFNKKTIRGIPLEEVTRRLRGFILDSQVQNAHEMSVILGCSSISDEVQEREEEESDKRTERISYLVPMLYAFSHALADGAMEYQRGNVPDSIKDLPKEVWYQSRTMMTDLSLAALMGSISQLVDMGLLEIPKQNKKR
jgi:hypothetical protein